LIYSWTQTKNPLPIFRRGLYDISDDVNVPLICPTRQVREHLSFSRATQQQEQAAPSAQQGTGSQGGLSMYFVAAVLAVLSGLFYAASRHEIGSFGATMCQYGSSFCDNPLLVLVAAGLAAVWGAFVSIR
jgi:hypothetical protein